jgi:rubrerythrin
VRQAFLANADEELEHRRKLEAVKAGEKALVPGKHVVDLKVADFVVAVEGSVSDLDFHDALVLSMKREKAAFRLYTALAALTEGELRQTFLGLAAEEAQHKLCFELQYDREFRQEE